MKCNVCGAADGASEMTDGRSTQSVCDQCRPIVTVFFFVHGSMDKAVSEAAQAHGTLSDVAAKARNAQNN